MRFVLRGWWMLMIGLSACVADLTYREMHADLCRRYDAGQCQTVELWLDSLDARCGTIAGEEDRLECLRERMPWVMEQDSASPESLWPQSVLRRGKGTCVPLAFLALMGMEVLRIRAEPVVLPGHVYVHLPDMGRNWEPNRRGYAHADEYYRERYRLGETAGRHARVLTLREFRGLFEYEMANRYAAVGRLREAEEMYREAARHWSDWRVVGNYAVLRAHRGYPEEARRVLDSLWESGVRDEKLSVNREILHRALSR